jgi:hypothetical protein
MIGRIEGDGYRNVCFEIPLGANAVRIGGNVFIHVGHGVDERGSYDLYRKVSPVPIKLKPLPRKRKVPA